MVLLLALLLTQTPVAEVDALVAEVDAHGRDAGWTVQRKSVPCGGTEADGELLLDPKGRPRRYTARFGGEDSVHEVTATYDPQGVLRFVYVKSGAVPDSHHEQRTWLDARGALIDQQEQESGTGWTWWRFEPKSKRLRDARKAFHRGACL